MDTYKSAYKQLNAMQKLAVDTIEGPVMVIAGPGTGKTQLISVRAAHILQSGDVSPQNILCLTFTESAVAEMRQRIVSMVGSEGHGINVATFHSFGSDIISRYAEFFYGGAIMKPIDELTRYATLQEIFSSLPHSNPLSVQFDNEFTYLRDSITALGQLKKAAISPKKLKQIVESNQAFVDFAEPLIIPAMTDQRLTKKQLPEIQKALDAVKNYEGEPVAGQQSLKNALVNDLEQALSDGNTPPVSDWKRRWLRKDNNGKWLMKDRRNNAKLTALASIYEKYQSKLNENRWYDFDDMVMQIVQELEVNQELKAELQEQYQYIMVDEFQDTNEAQMKLVQHLIDNPVHEGRPNILAVGDDDQAIYKFQGAEATNMHTFASVVREPSIITLTDVYRYPDELLNFSRQIADNIELPLTMEFSEVEKNLVSKSETKFSTEIMKFQTDTDELQAVAESIKQKIESGVKPEEIAVIARQHSHLHTMSDFLQASEIPVHYEQQSNVLDDNKIKQLIFFARVVIAIAEGETRTVNGLLPELLSYDFWGFDPIELWELNKQARAEKLDWLDAMKDNSGFADTAELLHKLAKMSLNEPLVYMLDTLIGAPHLGEKDETPDRSPFFAHYLDSKQPTNPDYLSLLANIKALRSKLIEYSPEASSLRDLLSFVDLQQTAGVRLKAKEFVGSQSSVNLLTAHKAKGMEFDHVYIVHVQDDIWGAKKRRRANLISMPANLRIQPAGDEPDDLVRLFYVAITRAKQSLHISLYDSREEKSSLPLRFIDQTFINSDFKGTDELQQMQNYVRDWTTKHIEASEHDSLFINNLLENYKLSISGLQTFVDVAQAGPQIWLLYGLLKFPGPVSPAAAYGTAIHAALNSAQLHLSKHGEPKSVDKLVLDFEDSLQTQQLSKSDFKFYLDRGKTNLSSYLERYYNDFNSKDKSEINFYYDNVNISDVPVTGLIDKLQLKDGNWQTGNVTIIDYKTGKSARTWKGRSEFEKLKLHRYKQQLIFYELLLDNDLRYKRLNITSRQLQFVEPQDDEFTFLDLDVSSDDKQRLQNLIKAVWEAMNGEELPDISGYSPDLKGIMDFENDLIEKSSGGSEPKPNETLSLF